jgi:hypothetical protein
VDLEVEVAAGADGVAGFADQTHGLSLQHLLAAPHPGRSQQVRVEIAPPLPFAVDEDEVAVEDRVEPALQNPPVADRDQPRPAGGGDVEAFVDAAAAARRVELPDRPSDPVRPGDREDVPVVQSASVAARDRTGGRRRERGQNEDGEEEGALQWCSITRSTMLYSFASSALMK